ncbi:hypothetical protein [Halobellus limi]|uniref:Uncharacterized protein n=1 Tax=Halobellus limi TaxID=699433 RepID=A0A1H5SZQ0_9EURY|nr:hypothetical protein [Halobellus limi]SEF56026.1 hypothetical protein SAMN04488133_0128 [Halobellus limi]
MNWDDLEDVDDWEAIDVDEDPPRRDPVKTMLLGSGVTLITEDVDEWR